MNIFDWFGYIGASMAFVAAIYHAIKYVLGKDLFKNRLS